MPRPTMRVVFLHEVKIKRNGETAIIEYLDPEMGPGMNFQVGPKLVKMTDRAVIDLLGNVERYSIVSAQARAASLAYTLENMIANFVGGIEACLATESR